MRERRTTPVSGTSTRTRPDPRNLRVDLGNSPNRTSWWFSGPQVFFKPCQPDAQKKTRSDLFGRVLSRYDFLGTPRQHRTANRRKPENPAASAPEASISKRN